MPTATFDGLNLVARDVDATLAFYRTLGVDIPDSAIWKTGSGPHHVALGLDVQQVGWDVDSRALASHYNQASKDDPDGARTLIGFRVESRDDVDARYATLTGAGHPGAQPPYDTFWGARYAIVVDPDGRHVGIMSPVDPDRRGAPPEL